MDEEHKDDDESSYSLFEHQVAGHLPFLSHQGTVFKLAWPNEIMFYKTLLRTHCPSLRPFVPQFHRLAQLVPQKGDTGMLDLVENSGQSDASTISGSGSGSVPSKSSRIELHELGRWGRYCLLRNKVKIRKLNNVYIVLENLTFKYHRPSILDLKIGTRQHGVGVSPSKARRQQQKCNETTSKSLGLRLCGMQVYKPDEGSFLYRDKYYGRSLDDEQLKRALKSFFDNGLTYHWDCVSTITERVRSLREAISKVKDMRFYSSSLLLLYEGNNSNSYHSVGQEDEVNGESHSAFSSTHSSSVSECPNETRVDMRLIDFAHCYWEGQPVHNADAVDCNDDSGCLFGIDNLLRILEGILAEANPDVL